MRKNILIILAIVLAACVPKTQPPSNQSIVEKNGYQMISVDELLQALQAKDFLFVNVHIPVEGNIPDTDINIPYDQIEKQIDKFPTNKNAKIILYCRSGSMGDTAAKSLVRLGYKNVFNLEGGYNAWEATGYQFPEE
jgi:rhodanese-related sulfurtransferase